MKDIEVQICHLGNGHGLHLPKAILDKYGMTTGDSILLNANNEKIFLIPQKRAKKIP